MGVEVVALAYPYGWPGAFDGTTERLAREAGYRVAFSALNLFAIYWFPYLETIPFHFIWISLTLLYGFRSWPTGPTMWILCAVMVTTGSGIALDVWRGTAPREGRSQRLEPDAGKLARPVLK